MPLKTKDKVVIIFFLLANWLPILVNIEEPVPIVIFEFPILKHWLAKIDDWESPITPVIGICFFKMPLISVYPKIDELSLTSGNFFKLNLKIFWSCLLHRRDWMLKKRVLEAFV